MSVDKMHHEGRKMKTRALPALLMLLSLLPKGVSADDVNSQPPKSFSNLTAAESHGCKKVNLYGPGRSSCVIEALEMHELMLNIYEMGGSGAYKLSGRVCVPSWYEGAKVKYQDFDGGGKDLVVVDTEGNTGTGVLQKILLVFGYNGREFVPVLLETTSYDFGTLGYKEELRMEHAIKNLGSREVTIDLHHEYVLHQSRDNPLGMKASWSERLAWHSQDFTFYETGEIEEMRKSRLFLWKNIARVRSLSKGIKLGEACDRFLEETKVMDILE